MWTTIGHDWAVELLDRALSHGRLAHSYLIAGPEHVGKGHLAIELAAALNCQGERPPCHACASCRRSDAGQHPDLIWIRPDPDRIHIDQVRNLAYDLALSPSQGRWRICVLTDIDRATPEAANALLKTLEEPPSHAVLILTVSDASLLLPTIVSRCQVITLRAVPPEAIEAAAKERGVEAARAHLLARLAAGRIGWALLAAASPELLEKHSGWIEELLSLLSSGRAARLMRAEALARSKELPEMLKTWEQWWRDVMLVASGTPEGCANTDRSEVLRALARSYDAREAGQRVAEILELQQQLDQNVNARLALEALLLSWRRHQPAEGLAATASG